MQSSKIISELLTTYIHVFLKSHLKSEICCVNFDSLMTPNYCFPLFFLFFFCLFFPAQEDMSTFAYALCFFPYAFDTYIKDKKNFWFEG